MIRKKDKGSAAVEKPVTPVAPEASEASQTTVAVEPETVETIAAAAVTTTSMQTRVSRLRDVLKVLQPIVPKRPNLDVLGYVLLEDGEASATDLSIRADIEYPEVEGRYLIPWHQVFEMLKHVPGDEKLTIEQGRKRLKLTWESGKATFDSLEPEDFPGRPHVEENVAIDFDGDKLVGAMMSVIDYCAVEDKRPILGCVNMSISDAVEIAAADGFSLAIQTLPVALPVQDNINIPSDTVRILDHLWGKLPPSAPLREDLILQILNKRIIRIIHDKEKIMFKFGVVTMRAALTEGTFPNYHQLVPQEPPMSVRFFAQDLERAVLSVKLLSKDSKELVRLEWDAKHMKVSASGGDKLSGEVENTIGVSTDNYPGMIAFDQMRLLKYLAGKEGLVVMGVTSRQGGVLFQYSGAPVVVLMPMFAPEKGESKPAPVPAKASAPTAKKGKPKKPSSKAEDTAETEEIDTEETAELGPEEEEE